MKGSIEAAVEQAFKAADANLEVPRDRATRSALLRRGLIPWLAGIDPDTGSPRRRIARISEIPKEAWPLINHLVDARLLSTDRDQATGEISIEPSHEALLRQWGLLEGWLAEDSGALITLGSVQRAARDWAADAQHPAWLTHKAGRLEEAERVARRQVSRAFWLWLGDYLAACRASENAEVNHNLRTARIITYGSAAAAIFLLAIIFIAGYQTVEVTRQKGLAEQSQKAAVSAADDAIAERRKSEDQRNEGLVIQALNILDSDPTASLAWLKRLSPTPGDRLGAARLIADAALSRGVAHHVLRVHSQKVASIAFSPDGQFLASAGDYKDTTIGLWDTRTNRWRLLGQHGNKSNNIWKILFSPDGKYLVSIGSSGTILLWHVATEEQIVIKHEHDVRDAAFSPDGMLVVAGGDGVIAFWRVTGEKVDKITEEHQLRFPSEVF